MNYKKNSIILLSVLIATSLYGFYSLYINDGSIVINIISESRTIPILLLKAFLSGIFISSIVHVIMFVVRFVKKNQGTKGTVFAVLSVFSCQYQFLLEW